MQRQTALLCPYASQRQWIVQTHRSSDPLTGRNMPDMDVDEHFGDGLKQYYTTKIEELQLIVNEKTQNLRRLQAQRNELNAKGELMLW